MDRLSLNQITTRSWTLPDAVAGCAHAGVGWIGLWRDKVAEVGVEAAARMVRDHGLRVSSLCRGGFFTGMGPDGPTDDGIADTLSGIEEAAALDAGVLVLVVGGVADGDLPASRRRVAEALDQLVPAALDHGIRLGLEPLHPMQCAERSVLSTLRQAVELAAPYPQEAVGVVVDEFHLWWDPAVEESIEAAAGRIVGFQVCDQLVPLPDPLLGRALPGDGPIDHRHLRACVEAAGYDGPIEVEIFNADMWARPGADVLADVVSAYRRHVAPG
ncbi:MAG: sugar phosphate isomerase/epimerase family protein [Acidimicrobiales bacterium]